MKNPHTSFYTAVLFWLLGTLLLIGLGVWQLQRLQWKESLLATVEREANTPATAPLIQSLVDPHAGYMRGIIKGGFVQKTLLLVGPRNLGTGNGLVKLVVAPFLPVVGPVVMVVVGSVPLALADQAIQTFTPPQGLVTLVGSLKASEKDGFLAPENAAQYNRWKRIDTEEMGNAMGISWVAPNALYLETIDGAAPPLPMTPMAATTTLSNNHLQYAIFWFVLAFLWLGLFFVWGVKPALSRHLSSLPTR